MARKKQEIQLQREIETQEEWEEVMAMEGLWVVDVYQEWCGPCQALVGNFRRLKNELGDSLLNFAMAKADTIDALEKYRGRCEPTFLFYAGGILVAYIHGANAPKVQRTITEQLAAEHKVLEGTGERKEVKDPVITRMQEIENEKQAEEEAQREAEDSGEIPTKHISTEPSDLEAEEAKGVTVAIIKPDAVAQGKADDIINEMKEAGIEIIAEEQRELTEDEARELYADLQEESYFEDLIKFITSGPSHLLVLTRGTTGETIVKDWREMIGPTNVEEAKEEAPDSLRAKFGDKQYMNALHGSSSSETAAKELAFFFPNLAIPTYKKKKENIQRTLALIRPEAFSMKKDEILQKISEAGFKIAMYKEVQLSKEQAAEFYKEHEQFSYFDSLVELMSSGPMLALGLARDDAIQAWRDALGPANVDDAMEKAPGSLRAQFTGPSGMNQFHGSDSEEAAKKEINYFFPMEQTVGVIKPDAIGSKDDIIKRIHEAGFRIAAQQETTITQEVAEILYPDHADKEYYEDLINHMTSGPTLFMVLSREDAVEGWRRELGDVNPEEAKNINPDSLRAQFGTDILSNAIHGSSNAQRAKEEMKAVFGDLRFNKDGTIAGEEPELDETAQVIERERAEPVSDIAPEYRNTAADETTVTADQTTDQDITANTTQDVTAQDATMDETQNPTVDETTADDSTVADTTMADETTVGDTTVDQTTAQADETEAADQTTTGGEESTQEGTTTADETGGATTADPTSTDPDTTTDQTTADQTTTDQTTAETTKDPEPPAAKEEEKEEEKPAAAATQETPPETQEQAKVAATEQQQSTPADNKAEEKADDKAQAAEGQAADTSAAAGQKKGEVTQEGENKTKKKEEEGQGEGGEGGEEKTEEGGEAAAEQPSEAAAE